MDPTLSQILRQLYQLDGETERLRGENADLKQQIEALRGQLAALTAAKTEA